MMTELVGAVTALAGQAAAPGDPESLEEMA